MKKLKNSIIILIGVLAITGVSCEKTDPIPEYFKFVLNGDSISFNYIELNDYTNAFVVEASPSENSVEKIQITFPDSSLNTYTDVQYDNMGGSVTKPNLKYTDPNGNSWQYFGSDYCSTCNFSITLEKYSTGSGQVSGEFDGKLWAFAANGASTSLSILIEDGQFSYKRPYESTSK